tara:strand:+ start:145 stop:2220 length:2076 start_codon:yes stop_codon:yes gene_type:complete
MYAPFGYQGGRVEVPENLMVTPGADGRSAAYAGSDTDDPFRLFQGQPVCSPINKKAVEDNTAWLRTAAAHGAADADIKAYAQAFTAQQFDNRAVKLYDSLMAKGETVVSMSDCEKTYDFLWKLDSNSPHNDDPYFVRRIHNEFEQSLMSFCITLDLTCTSLAGLGSDQTSHSALEDMMRVRSHAANEIYKMMCSSTKTNTDVVSRTKELESLYTSKHVRKYREEMNEAVAGVRSLACIAASAAAGQDMNEAMQHHYATARSVCLNPPRHLTEQMRAVGISLNVLSACFASSGHAGMVGASSLAPPWAKAVDIVSVFFAHHNVATSFGSACVSALNLMRIECSEPDESHVWCGVEVMDATSDTVLHASCVPTFDMVQALHSPAHRGGCTGKAVVVTNPSPPRALRVVRFLRTLVRCAEEGYFDPRCAKASVLLSSVARFRTENRFCVHNIAETVIRPLEKKIDAHCPLLDDNDDQHAQRTAEVDKLLEEEEEDEQEVIHHPAVDAVSPLPAVPVVGDIVVTSNTGSTVPLKLERDYHICRAFFRTINVEGGHVFLKTIGNILKASDGYFSGYSDRSVEQSVSHVVTKKCLPQAHGVALAHSVMEYVACPAGQRGGGHLNFDSAGAVTMKRYLETALMKMEQGDHKFAKDWHVSRSSRNKARAIAVTKMIGNDAPVSSVVPGSRKRGSAALRR